MNTYKVLFPHLGDRNYAVGDTRELEPHQAEPLVSGGMLELVGQADNGGAVAVADDNQRHIDALTQERDQARVDLANAQRARDEAAGELRTMSDEHQKLAGDAAELRRERDEARAALDASNQKVSDMERERDQARADLASKSESGAPQNKAEPIAPLNKGEPAALKNKTQS